MVVREKITQTHKKKLSELEFQRKNGEKDGAQNKGLSHSRLFMILLHVVCVISLDKIS